MMKTAIIDSHCHLSLVEEKDNSLHQFLHLYTTKDLCLLDVGLEPGDFALRKKKFGKYKKIYFSLGLHPNYTQSYDPDQLKQELQNYSARADAIGECGLDWHHQKADRETQRKIFRVHLEAALEHRKPLIIHSRNSLSDILSELEQFLAERKISCICDPEKGSGIMHCFSGSWEQAQRCLELGFYISFAANISYKKNEALRDILARIPENRLLLETDAPYLSHQKIRGSMNHPGNMPLLYETAAAIKGISSETLVCHLKNNLHRLIER